MVIEKNRTVSVVDFGETIDEAALLELVALLEEGGSRSTSYVTCDRYHKALKGLLRLAIPPAVADASHKAIEKVAARKEECLRTCGKQTATGWPVGARIYT